jgi:hypothetical protein
MSKLKPILGPSQELTLSLVVRCLSDATVSYFANTVKTTRKNYFIATALIMIGLGSLVFGIIGVIDY